MISDEGDNLLRYLHAVSYQLACLLDIDGQHHGKLPSSSSSSIKSHGKQSHKREKKARNDTTRTPVRLQKSSLKSSPEHTGLNHNNKAATKQPPHQQASRANKRRKRRNGGNSNEHGVSLETNNLDDTNESIERKQQQQQQHLNQLQTHHLQANISIQGFSDAQSALDAQLSLNIGDDMTLTGDHGVSISPSATHLSPIDPSIAPFGNSCSNQLHPQIVVPQIPTSSSSNIYYRGINGSHNINHNNLVDSYHQIHDNHNNHQQHQHHHDFGGSSSHESIPIAVTTLNSDQDHQHGHHMHNQHHLQTSIVGVVGNQTSDSIHGNSMASDCYQNINQQQQQQQQHHHQQHEHQSHQHQHESHHGHHMLSADHHQIHSYHNQLDHQWLGPTSSTAATQSGANSATHHQHNHHHHQQQQHHHQLHQEPLDQVVVSPLSPTSGSHQSIDQVHFAPLYHHSYYSSHQSDQLDSFQHLTNDEFTPTNNANGGVGGPGGGGGGGGGVGVTNPNSQANSPASLIHMGGASTKSSSDGQQQSMNADSSNQGNNYDQLHLHSQQLHDINSSYHDGHHHHHDHHQHHHHHHHQLAHNHHHHQHHHVMPLVNGIEPSSVILQDINLASATWSSPEDLYSI